MHKSAVDRESCILAVRVRGRRRFVRRGHSDQASINGIRTGSVSALGADQDLVDHGNRAVAPDLKQEDLARGGDPARERRDVHLMGNQDDGFRGRQAEQELPEFGRLRAGPVPCVDAPVDASIFRTAWCMRSGAVVCPASRLRRFSGRRACMEIRGSGPYRFRELERSTGSAWFSRPGLVDRLPLPVLRPAHIPDGSRVSLPVQAAAGAR